MARGVFPYLYLHHECLLHGAHGDRVPGGADQQPGGDQGGAGGGEVAQKVFIFLCLCFLLFKLFQ